MPSPRHRDGSRFWPAAWPISIRHCGRVVAAWLFGAASGLHEVMSAALSAGASDIYLTDDITPFSQRRLSLLQVAADAAGIAVHREVGVTVVPTWRTRALGSRFLCRVHAVLARMGSASVAGGVACA